MRRAAPALLAAALLWAPAAAGAADVDGATLRELAARAAIGDAAARGELLAVESVDGQAVDVAALLAGAGDDEAARLRALADAGGGTGPAADAAAARRQAQQILAAARFGSEELTPGRTLLDRIFAAIDDLAAWILPAAAGDNPGWVLAGIVVVTLAIVLAVQAVRHRTAAAPRPRRRGPAPAAAAEDPDEVARAADAAGSAGDYADAVRLRFRAGLLYLDRRDVLPFDPAMTTGRFARTVPGPAAHEVARSFDAIVYGGRPATADDDQAARRRWAEILRVPS